MAEQLPPSSGGEVSMGSGCLGSWLGKLGALDWSWPVPCSEDEPPRWRRDVCVLASGAVWRRRESPAHAEEQMWEIWFLSCPWLPRAPWPQGAGAALLLRPDWAVVGTWQSPAQWRSLRSETQLGANPCCQLSLGPPPFSFPTPGWQPRRGSRAGCLWLLLHRHWESSILPCADGCSLASS